MIAIIINTITVIVTGIGYTSCGNAIRITIVSIPRPLALPNFILKPASRKTHTTKTTSTQVIHQNKDTHQNNNKRKKIKYTIFHQTIYEKQT